LGLDVGVNSNGAKRRTSEVTQGGENLGFANDNNGSPYALWLFN